MLKHRRIVFFGLSALLLGMCVGINNGARAAASAGKNVEIVKQYDLADGVDYVEFIIEGNQGEFTATIQLPDGHLVKNVKSRKLGADDLNRWIVVWGIERPTSGTYAFSISAARNGYYNLTADIPLFRDVAKHWSRVEITNYVSRGIIRGYGDGTFRPDAPVTGEALAKMLVLALTEEQPHGKRQWRREFRWRITNGELANEMGHQEYDFAGIGGAGWFKPYLTAIDALGIRETDSLKNQLSRQDAALMVSDVMKLINDKLPETKTYSDTTALSNDIQDAISRVSGYAIFGGYPDGTFQPSKAVTRAEAVKVISRLEFYLTS